MSLIRRDYAHWIHGLAWMTREAWTSIGDGRDPDPVTTGIDVTLTGEPGTVFVSSELPHPLDHDNLFLTLHAEIEGGELGVEWCQAKKGKFHPVGWCDAGSVRIEALPAVRTTAGARITVRIGDSGATTMRIADCFAEMEPRLSVRVNQVGYNAGQPKSFVVESNCPLDGDATFRIIAPIVGPGREFETVFEGTLESTGSIDVWDRHYWAGDFSALDTPSNYYIHAFVGDMEAESPVFALGEAYLENRTTDPAQRYFWFQRCGMAIPGWHDACHLDDRVTTENGVSIEATGAWHDAGDYNKYNGFTPLSVYSLAYAAESAADFCETHRHTGRDDVLDEAVWGMDYLAKVQDPKTGKLWGQHFSGYGYWGIPERETDNVIGGDDDRVATGDTKSLPFVSAFARLGRMLNRPDLAGRAMSHWKLAYDPESKNLQYLSEVAIAGMELERATDDASYGVCAAEAARGIVECQSSDDRFDGWYAASPGGSPFYAVVTDGQPPAALALWIRANPDHEFAATARQSLLRWARFKIALADNPFGISMCWTGNEPQYFMNFTKDGDWHVGDNSHYLSDAWAAFLIHQVTGDRDILRFGWNQMNWVLGMNPYGMCMMHGEGTLNTRVTHHRYNTIVGHPEGSPAGSVFNGIVRFRAGLDLPLWDMMEQGTSRYECNECWLPHNCFYLLAITELAGVS
jgi:hypothetical protein